jgi:hypothetical protein
LFPAGILARQKATILWVQERPDLFTPALAGVGLKLERVIYLQAGDMCWPRWKKAGDPPAWLE